MQLTVRTLDGQKENGCSTFIAYIMVQLEGIKTGTHQPDGGWPETKTLAMGLALLSISHQIGE